MSTSSAFTHLAQSARRHAAVLAAVVPVALATVNAGAGNITWSGANGGTWSATSNWSGGVLPGSADTAVFSFELATGDYAVTLDAAQSIAALNVTDTNTTTASAFTVNSSGPVLTFAGSSPSISAGLNSGKILKVVNADFSGTGATFTKSGAAQLWLELAATNNFAGLSKIVPNGGQKLIIRNIGAGTFSPQIASSDASPNTSVRLMGSGVGSTTLNLGTSGLRLGSGSFEFGKMTVNLAGSDIQTGNISLSPSTGPDYTTGSSTLNWSGTGTTGSILVGDQTGNASGPVTAAFNMTGGSLTAASGDLQLGNVSHNYDSIVSQVNLTGGSMTVRNLTVGRNTLGASTTGGTVPVVGVLTIGAGASLTSTGTMQVATRTDNTNTANATTLNVSGTVNLDGGSLTVASAIAKPTANSTVASTSSAVFNFNGGTLAYTGTGVSELFPGWTGANDHLYVKAAGAIIDTGLGNVAIARPLEEAASSTGGGLTKTGGSGVLTLSGANTYTGNTTVNNGILVAATPASLPGYNTPGKVTVASGAGIGVSAGGTGQFAQADLDTLLSSATIASGATVAINVDSGNTFTYASNLTKPVAFTKLGAGALTLSGANSYTGPTNVNGGALLFATPASIGSGGLNVADGVGAAVGTVYAMDQSFLNRLSGSLSTMVVALAGDSSNNLDFDSPGLFTSSLGAVGNATYSGQLTMSSPYRLGGGGGTLTVASTLTGGNTVEINGVGSAATVILSGDNSASAGGYTGTTTIFKGVAQFNSANAVGGSGRTVTVNSGAVVAAGYPIDNAFLNRLVEGTTSFTVALAADSGNNLDMSSSAGATLPNANLGAVGNVTYSGNLTPVSGAWRFGGGSGVLNVATNLAGATNVLVSGGTVNLVGNNTFTGQVQLNGGDLLVTNPASLSTASAITSVQNNTTGNPLVTGHGLKPGADNLTITTPVSVLGSKTNFTYHTNGYTVTQAGAISNASGYFIKDGAGTLVVKGGFNSATSIDKGFLVNAGTLAFDGADSSISLTGWNQVTNGAALSVRSGSQTFNFGTSATTTGSQLVIGQAGTGNQLSVSGGTFKMIGGYLEVGAFNSGSYSIYSGSTDAALNITGGVADLTQVAGIELASRKNNAVAAVTGTVNLDGGTVLLGAQPIKGGSNPGTSIVNFNGGTLKPTVALANMVTGVTTAAVKAGGAVIDTNGFNAGIGASPLVHAASLGAALDGGLTKNGSGTLTVTGANTYTGPTLINAGTLAIGANNTLPAVSEVTVGANATLDTNTKNQAVGLLQGSGTVLVSGSLTAGDANSGTFTGSLSGTGTFTKAGAGTQTVAGMSISNLAVTAGKLVTTVTPSVGSLSITGGQLDTGAGKLVLTNTTPAQLDAMLLAGRNGGTWDGNGIISANAAADPAKATAIGWAKASDISALSWDTVFGLAGTELLTKYTYYGDLNLDGKVTADDYALLDRGFARYTSGAIAAGAARWLDGDVNYDGVVDSADYLLTDTAAGKQSGTLSPALLAERQAEFGPAYVAALTAAVPEPASLGLLGLAGMSLLGRRSRRR